MVYIVKKTKSKFVLVEIATGFVIKTGSKKAIRSLYKSLKRGTGFKGETPKFFINKKEQLLLAVNEEYRSR